MFPHPGSSTQPPSYRFLAMPNTFTHPQPSASAPYPPDLALFHPGYEYHASRPPTNRIQPFALPPAFEDAPPHSYSPAQPSHKRCRSPGPSISRSTKRTRRRAPSPSSSSATSPSSSSAPGSSTSPEPASSRLTTPGSDGSCASQADGVEANTPHEPLLVRQEMLSCLKVAVAKLERLPYIPEATPQAVSAASDPIVCFHRRVHKMSPYSVTMTFFQAGETAWVEGVATFDETFLMKTDIDCTRMVKKPGPPVALVFDRVKRKMVCSECHAELTCIQAVKRHCAMSEHSATIIFKCRYCTTQNSRRDVMTTHLKITSNEHPDHLEALMLFDHPRLRPQAERTSDAPIEGDPAPTSVMQPEEHLPISSSSPDEAPAPVLIPTQSTFTPPALAEPNENQVPEAYDEGSTSGVGLEAAPGAHSPDSFDLTDSDFAHAFLPSFDADWILRDILGSC
ncbi:hypothetical protein HGRIS_012989 [Hohenbuehelia grisea]|uniref:C2H2-type domain-containing protein n=1 Tax=Hohenbuehelia grisea TaxID=104357 RepID=A0ABR3IU10_9AGAR